VSVASRVSRRVAVVLTLAIPVSLRAAPQDGGSALSEKGLSSSGGRFRLQAELKAGYRDSAAEEARVVVTPDLAVFMRTPSPYGSFELANVALIGEADLTPDISAKLRIHFLDLYNRNPSSSDDRVFVREAWIRFGRKYEAVKVPPGTTLYVQAGMAPRFSKQIVRHMESYGMWGTAVGRFEELGVEAGGSLGRYVYWRLQAVNGNPLFMRDTNALAGDNGTPERTTPEEAETLSVYQTGFPILYDAKAKDSNFRGSFQVGGGLGVRIPFGTEKDGVDLLGWYFRRTLADRVPIRGSFYSGDIRLLQGVAGISLPIEGRDKTEWGGNLEARWGGLSVFGQGVRQEIAGLVRHGYEGEVAFRFQLNGLFLSGETPVLNWVEPVVRISRIDNDFDSVPGFVAPSFWWDWGKYDVGVRVGILRGVDLTAEYTRHDARARTTVFHMDELLVTLRTAF
jgi:hypothetical protein